MAHKVVVDLGAAAGGATPDGRHSRAVRVPLTPEEEAERAALTAALAAGMEADERRRAFVAALRPDAPLLRKIRMGESLSDGELDRLVRWLAAKELVGEIID